MPDAPETPEPPPQGRVASTARELRWFAKFLAAINGEQAPRYVALVLTAALMVLSGYLLYEKRDREIREDEHSTTELGMRLSYETQEKERDRVHQKLMLDLLLRDTKDDRKTLSQNNIALGMLANRIELLEKSVRDLIRTAFPGKVWLEVIPGVLRRFAFSVAVAPMPRDADLIRGIRDTGQRVSTTGLQPPGDDHHSVCPGSGPR